MDAFDLCVLRYVYTGLYIAHEMNAKAQANALDVLDYAGYVLEPGERASDVVQRLDRLSDDGLRAALCVNRVMTAVRNRAV
jgi:hypothetical protein